MTNSMSPEEIAEMSEDHQCSCKELDVLRGNLSLANAEVQKLHGCWSEALANVTARNQEIERLKEVLNCPQLTVEAPAEQFKAVLRDADKGLPVNSQDLINALWWRVRNQTNEIGRLHERLETQKGVIANHVENERRSSEPKACGCGNTDCNGSGVPPATWPEGAPRGAGSELLVVICAECGMRNWNDSERCGLCEKLLNGQLVAPTEGELATRAKHAR